jgi:UDP-N-acetylmuramoyl-L-alanyl-D-glutamate--2,6-diaminopimelate ligase
MRHAITASKLSASTFLSSKNEGSSSAPSLQSDAKWLQCKPPHLDVQDAVSMKQIFPGNEIVCGDDLLFSGVAEGIDSVQPGNLIVYRIGQNDPMKVIAAAMARGAAGILSEQMLPCPLPQCIVPDVDSALTTVHAALLGRPDEKLLTIGVAGSAGKTTTSLMISSLLRGASTRTAFQTDLGDCDGVVQSTPETAVPSGRELVQWLAEAVDGECQAAVMEINDNDARQGKYDSVQFDILVITGKASLSSDFGPSGLQCMLENVTSGGVVVASNDDEKALQTIRDAGCRVLTYSVEKRSDVSARVVEQSGGMMTMMVTESDTTALLETPLCGAANAANLAAAAAVGVLMNQSVHQIVQSLSGLRSVPGRGQRLVDFNHANVVLDVAGTPARAAAAMKTARHMKANGQLWCVLAIDENDSADTLATYGQLMERYSNKAVVTCHRSMKSSFLAASHGVLDGVEHCAAMRLVADPRRAVEWALGEAGPNDTVLVLGGVKTTNAHQQRTELKRVAEWVQTHRDSCEQQDASSKDTGQQSNPNILPMHLFKK